jgi:nitrogen fixation NifU-like protein
MDYSPQVWDHFRKPRHAGEWPLSGAVATGFANTPASKGVLQIQLQIADGRIEAARFMAHGCPSTIAAGSWLCEWLKGREVETAVRLTSSEIADALALSPVKRFCAVMAEDALKAALSPAQRN